MHLYALLHIISLCFGDSFFSQISTDRPFVKQAVGWSNCTICRASVLAGSGLREPQCVNNKAQSIPQFCLCKGPSLLSLSFLIFSLFALLADPSSTQQTGEDVESVLWLSHSTILRIHLSIFGCLYALIFLLLCQPCAAGVFPAKGILISSHIARKILSLGIQQ